MAMKEYFSHDYGSRIDRKMVNLQMKHGMIGVGIYWCLVEIAYENNGMIPANDCERIAFELRTEYERIKSVLNDFELFYQNDGFYRSESIDRRLQEREEKSASARRSINARWGKPKDQAVDTNVIRTNEERNTIKVKKSKKKKSKEEDNFETFWELYHKETKKPKTDKEDAIKKWNKLTKKEKQLAIDKIPEYAKTNKPEFLKKARTYLGNKNFNDELIPFGAIKKPIFQA